MSDLHLDSVPEASWWYILVLFDCKSSSSVAALSGLCWFFGIARLH